MMLTGKRSLTEHDLDDAVLYDVFYESGTILGGLMVEKDREAQARGDEDEAEYWRNEILRLDAERRAVPWDDREAQIAAKRRWDARAKELRWR